MRKLFFLILTTLPSLLHAQTQAHISYEEAVSIALENNFNIQIAKNNAAISSVQNTLGNAGFLPKADVTGNANIANNRTHQKFSNGTSVNKSGVISNNENIGAYLNWTVFDGKKMFATKEKLNILEQQGSLSLKIEIENIIENVTLLYYQIVKQNQLIRGIQTAMDVSDERINIARQKLSLGAGSKVELLQAQLDLNAQRSNLITQQNFMKEYKSQLMELLKTEPSSSFTTDSVFTFSEMKSMEEIKAGIERSNHSISFSKLSSAFTQQSIKELQAQSYPKVGLTANYVFGRNANTAGLTLLNQNLGFNTGLTFTWNAFNGYVLKNQIKVAKLNQLNSQLQESQIKQQLFTAAFITYTRWLGAEDIAELEEKNIKLAEESLAITTERMKLGLGNYLEVKESQSSYENAITRLVNARYDLKEAETKLKKLRGELVK